MKKLSKIVLGVVLLLVIGLIVAWLAVNSIAKAGIERVGTYALGVQTRVEKVNVSLLGGKVTLKGLTIHNPEGFQTPHVMKTGTVDVDVAVGSVLGDTVEVRKFVLDGLDMYMEQQGLSSNVQVLMGNIRHFGEKTRGEEKPPDEAGKRKLKIDRIEIRNVVAHVQFLPVGGEATTVDVEVPEIILRDVTTDNAGGVVLGEVLGRIVPAVVAAVVEQGGGIIPADFSEGLKTSVAGAAKAMGDQAVGLVGTAVESVGKAVEEIGKGLEGLLKPKKAPEEPKP